MVEWDQIIEEFEEYPKALELFNSKSPDNDIILYEIRRSVLDGTIIKKIPILNTKQSKKRQEELEKQKLEEIQKIKKEETIKKQESSTTKNKISEIKYRIILLIVIVFAFIILLYVLSQIVTTSDSNSHLITYEIYQIHNNNFKYI
jgi:hypothetical protein